MMNDQQLIRDILPVELWYSYRLARSKGQEIPTYVLEYFDSMSDDIWEFAHRPPSDIGKALQEVFQCEPSRGRNSLFYRYAQFKTRMAVLVNWHLHRAVGNWSAAKSDLADGQLWPLTLSTRSIDRIVQESGLYDEEEKFRLNKESYFSPWLKERRERLNRAGFSGGSLV